MMVLRKGIMFGHMWAKNFHWKSSELSISFSLHLDNDGENLFSLNWTFDDSLGVTDKIIFFIFNIINTVHDIFTVASLIEHHISFPKFTGGAFQADVVSCVDQEWSHAAARDDHAHLLSFLNEVRSMDIYSFVSTVFIMGRISHYRIISSLVRYLCRVKAASGFMLHA